MSEYHTEPISALSLVHQDIVASLSNKHKYIKNDNRQKKQRHLLKHYTNKLAKVSLVPKGKYKEKQ